MSGTVKFIAIIIVAAVIGVSSANYVAEGHAGLFNRSKGEWNWWPSAGSTAIDPYTRFYFMSRGRLPLSKFETLELEATQDNGERALSVDCVYQLTGRIPDARWWSLASTVAGTDSEPPDDDNTIGSNDVLLDEDGTLTVTISKEIQPGNWIKPKGDDSYSLLLRLYNPVSNFGSGAALGGELPTITRQVCR